MSESPERQDAPSATPKVRGTDLRLAPVAFCVWVGALCGLAWAVSEIWIAGVIGGGVLSLVGAGWWRRSSRFHAWGLGLLTLGTVLLAGALAVLSASNAVEQRDSDPLTALVGKGRYVTITAVVDGHGRAASAPWLRGVLETTAKVQTVQEGGSGGDAEPRKSHMRVQLQIGPVTDPELVAAELLPPGTQIALSGFVREPAFPRGTLVAAMSADDVMVLRAAPTWRRSIASMRWKMSEVAAESAGALGPLITGMAIGDDDNLARPVKESMLTTSLTHLTAVSGSHIAISLAVIHRLFAGRYRLQAVLVAGFLILVLVVVGAEPSVVRATSMSALAAWGLFRRRPGQPLALLFVVITVVVLWDPWAAVSLGFALSAIATLGILTWGRAMARASKRWVGGLVKKLGTRPWWERHPRVLAVLKWFLETTGDVFAISLSAYVVALPVLSLVNSWLPSWGLLANVLVSPIVAPLTLLGLAVAVTCVPLPAVAGLLARAALPFAWWMNKVNMTLAAWPLARMPWPEGAGGAVLLAVLLVLAFVGVRSIRRIIRGRDEPSGRLSMM